MNADQGIFSGYENRKEAYRERMLLIVEDGDREGKDLASLDGIRESEVDEERLESSDTLRRGQPQSTQSGAAHH